MNLVEIILISIGLSLDIFAVTICEGAMLARIEKKKLVIMCAIFCLWQLVAVQAGNLISLIPIFADSTTSMQVVWNGISITILIGLGVYMLYKAWRRETIFEHVSDISYKKVCITALITSIDAFFAGIGFGFMEAEFIIVQIAIETATILSVILGVYTGYRMGYEQKTKAYGIGGIILICSAIEIVFRSV